MGFNLHPHIDKITKLITDVSSETVVSSETGMLLVGLAGGAGVMLDLVLLYKVLEKGLKY